MHWHDYRTPQKKTFSPKWVGLYLGFAVTVFLGVNQTYIDDLSGAQAFVQALNLTFPNVRDDTGNISEGRYRVLGLPTTVFITPEGSIAHVN